jgi:hypothetical protein
MKENTNHSSENTVRRKFLFGLGILSLFPILKLSLFSSKSKPIACSPEQQQGTMKLLTQDGKLVEVDISKIQGTAKKASKDELIAWVKR